MYSEALEKTTWHLQETENGSTLFGLEEEQKKESISELDTLFNKNRKFVPLH